MAEAKFVPKPGQVDYTNIRYAPVVNSVVTDGARILLVQRSAGMRLYPGYWSGISGFLDSADSIEEKIEEELREELNIGTHNILSVTRGRPLLQEAPEYNKTWLVVPLYVKIKPAPTTLNWESDKVGWFTQDEIKDLQLLPGYQEVLNEFEKQTTA